jgi:predicted dehydrogenase
MRILICGLGSVGRRHLRNLVTLGVEDLVLLRSGKSTLPEDELTDFAQEYDLDEALERWKPDAVIISNPTSLHMQMALPSAAAGCHIFFEKPVSHTMEGMDVLERTLIETGKQVLVGFQFRHHPGLKQVKRLIEGGAIGEVIGVRVNWGEYLPNWHPWEDYRLSYSARRDLGGGVVLTLCHPFDYLRWIVGEIAEVTAELNISGTLELDIEDSAEVLLRFDSGVIGNVHLDYLTRPPNHFLEIIGTEGRLEWNNEDGAVRWWSTSTDAWLTITAPAGFERNHLFLDEMRHFLRVIAGDDSPICSLQEGIKVLEIILAVHQSSSEGNRISLPLSGIKIENQ